MEYEEIFRQAAKEHGLDWHVLLELGMRESALNSQAVGRDGEKGLMQILPSTWDEWAPRVGVRDPLDAESNVRVAAAYLAWIREKLAGAGRRELYWALVAYNWGIGNVLRLLLDGGQWSQVPGVCQDYATGIALAAEADLLAEQLGVTAG